MIDKMIPQSILKIYCIFVGITTFMLYVTSCAVWAKIICYVFSFPKKQVGKSNYLNIFWRHFDEFLNYDHVCVKPKLKLSIIIQKHVASVPSLPWYDFWRFSKSRKRQITTWQKTPFLRIFYLPPTCEFVPCLLSLPRKFENLLFQP